MHNKPELNEAPVLVEISRGQDVDGLPIIELVHRGLIAVVSGDGKPVISLGDGETKVHLRSTAKPFQILPLFDLGLFNEQEAGLKPYDLALLSSSHAGAPLHVTRVEELLHRINLTKSALRCGIHPPQDETSRRCLGQNKEEPNVLHNNCSGKHVAMLMACQKLGFDITSYEQEQHPLEQLIKTTIGEVADFPRDAIAFGIDGCSLPSWVLPIKNVALMYARLGYWQHHLPDDKPRFLAEAFQKIWTSVITYPQYLAGDGRFDTELIKSGSGAVFCKTGADGMQALAILPCKKYPTGLGIVIKVADGDPKLTIRPLLVKQVLEHLGLWPTDARLENFLPTFKNLRGLITGRVSNKLEKHDGCISNSDDKR